jgi:hypothetical protein
MLTQDRTWNDLIADENFYAIADEEYRRNLASRVPNHVIRPNKVDLDWDSYLRHQPDQDHFFHEEKGVGVRRSKAVIAHGRNNLLGEHHFDGTTPQHKAVKQALDLQLADVSMNIQLPGNQIGVHTDLNRNFFQKFYVDELKEAKVRWVRKYIIFLQPWSVGQIFGTGNSTYTDWSKGTVLEFPWYMPHYTANCSMEPRAILFVCGIKKK